MVNQKATQLDENTSPKLTDLLYGVNDPSGTPVSKKYIIENVLGIKTMKDAVRVATTANITLSGEQTIDGISTSTDRVLVKDQTAGSENGIYVSAAGAWTRAKDFDTDDKATSGGLIIIQEGTAKEDTIWILTTDEPITIGTTDLVFTEFVGGGGGGTKTIPFPIVETGPEGIVGVPDIHDFVTAGMKQDGWLLPDGASTSKINFRGYLPPTLAGTPNMKIIVMIVTLGASSPVKDVHLTITGEYKNDDEDMDVAQNDVNISADITLTVTTETVSYHTFDPATDPANNDIFTFQIERDPANAGDDFPFDILIFVKGVVDV